MSQALMPPLNATSGRGTSVGLAAIGIATAVFLGQRAIATNLERTCTVDDTPYLELCPTARSSEARSTELRSRIAANPGDAGAYVLLAMADQRASGRAVLEAAARLSPVNANVVAMQAVHALEQQDLPGAVDPLVALVEHGHNDKAALVLARLIAAGQWQLLSAHVVVGSKWLAPVLAQIGNTPGPFSSALPLVVLGLDRGVLEPSELMPYVRQLKAAGAWGDAYSLWVALHQGVSPTLYNAGFDQPFEEDGFDWEVASQQRSSRAGAVVARASDDKRGALLDIRFTGRPFAVPLVRQHVFLGPGRYRLRGDYRSSQLRMEQGLAWTVHCTSSAQASKSAALGDTSNAWRQFEFEFSIPANCGWVAALQLETFAPLDATLGSRGRASFDALSLVKLER